MRKCFDKALNVGPNRSVRDALAVPLIKQDVIPLARDELSLLRARLVAPYQYEVVAHEEARYLFVRSPNEEPDPVADLEACLDRVPDWATRDISDVFLLAARGSFHVPATTAHPLLERRLHIDEALVQGFRSALDPNYGLRLDRVADDPDDHLRMGIRVPRTRVAELTETDLVRLTHVVGPLLDDGRSATIRFAYLIAEEDHLRLPGEDLFADVAPRWRDLQRIIENPIPKEEVARPLVPRRRPKRVINVRPLFEVEEEVHALTEDEAHGFQQAVGMVEQHLRGHGFDVRTHVEHEGTAFELAAERANGYPRRLALKTYVHFGSDEAETMLRQSRALDSDLLLVVAVDASDDALRRCLASKVKVIKPHEVASFSL